jgi:hypothetical protein
MGSSKTKTPQNICRKNHKRSPQKNTHPPPSDKKGLPPQSQKCGFRLSAVARLSASRRSAASTGRGSAVVVINPFLLTFYCLREPRFYGLRNPRSALRLAEAALLHIPETAFIHISETALLHMPEAALLQMSETALLHMPEAAFINTSETALLHMPEAALHQMMSETALLMLERKNLASRRLSAFALISKPRGKKTTSD